MALAAINLRILDAGELVEGATVTIRRETPGKPLVQCFSDRAGTVAIGNPFISADGKVLAFVAAGAYEVAVTKGAFSDVYHYVAVGTAAEADANQIVGLQWQFTPDAVIDGIVYRDAYDGEPASFSVLVTADDTNLDGDSNPLPTVYFKLSDESADWSSAITWLPVSDDAIPRAVNGLTPAEGLVVKTVSDTTVDIDADAIVLFNDDGRAERRESIDLTVDITASGANGLDTGAEGSSTWYAIWVIYNPATESVAALLSESFSAPTLPAGYTHKGLVGAVYNDSGSDFVTFFQTGNDVISAQVVVLADGTQTTYTAVDLAAAVPPNARTVLGIFGPNSSSGANTVGLVVAPAGSGTDATYGLIALQAGAYPSTNTLFMPFMLPLSTPQSLMYFVFGTNARGSITANGWQF